MVKDIFIFENGLVAVTDENGKQIVKLQGRWKEKAVAIYKKANKKTVWHDSRAQA